MRSILAIAVLAMIPFVHAQEFQTTKTDLKFEELMSTLDVNGPDITFEYKNTGTSVGMKIRRADKNIGKWMPDQSATNIEGQVVAYHLARFLGMSQIVMPSANFRMTGKALETFRAFLQNAPEKNKWRRINRDDILAKIARDPSGLNGVYLAHLKTDSPEVRGLAAAESNTINSSHPIAQFIRATGPMPSTRQMSLAGVKNKEGRVPYESEVELARQFSQIMVLDILTGQWDRWSGGNVEAGFDGDRVFFLARDNGGSSMSGAGTFKKYSSIVTRFDRAQYQRLQELQAVLSDANTAAQFAAKIHLKSNPATLRARVNQVLAHIMAQVSAHGEQAAFFP
jgi:chorismate mutase